MSSDLENQNINVVDLLNKNDKKTIFRVCKNKDNPYVQINKTCLDDPLISLKAKGLLSYLLSKPDDWVVYRNEILKHCSDGKDSLQTAINELKNTGYLKIAPEKNKNGTVTGWATSVFEIPQLTLTLVQNHPEAENPILDDASVKKCPKSHESREHHPESGNPDSGFPRAGKSAPTKNNNTKKQLLKKNNNKSCNNKLSKKHENRIGLCPDDPVVVSLFKKLNGAPISKKLLTRWVMKHGSGYVDEKINLLKTSNALNPAAYLNDAINLDWKLSSNLLENNKISLKELILHPTHEENVTWYKSLVDEEKSKCLELAIYKQYNFGQHLEHQNVSIFAINFTDHSLFRVLMSIIGRA